jgi:hypothetical protein
MDASYLYLTKTGTGILDTFLCTACIVDIVINFRTGYRDRKENIVMKPGSIAKLNLFRLSLSAEVLLSGTMCSGSTLFATCCRRYRKLAGAIMTLF